MANTTTADIPNDQDHLTQTHYDTTSSFEPRCRHSSNFQEIKRRGRWGAPLYRLGITGNGKQPVCVFHAMPHERITLEQVVSLKEMYDTDLLSVGWEESKRYAEAKEVELWHIFHDLDLDGSGRLDAHELLLAPNDAGTGYRSAVLGIEHPPSHLLPPLSGKPSPSEFYRCRCRIDKNGCSTPVNAPVGISLSAKTQSLTINSLRYPSQSQAAFMQDKGSAESMDNVHEEEEKHPKIVVSNMSPRFLLAGGIAGVVSRTCTAPFDRLKVFLITRPPDPGGYAVPARSGLLSATVIKNAVARIYAEGGILAFWTGNGLSVAKVFPESAIKFFTYESAKCAFARYWDGVDDPRDISGTSRFISGGIGGITSQLAIYPVETLKTQMMSNMGKRRRLAEAIRHVWLLGGLRAYYRGLTVGLIGVFPYSAIDMSTFEALKLAYVRSTGREKPGVLTLLAFGSISGSVGAISVYPINLVRTRLQASGSPGHPQRYKGILDVAVKTWERDGWRGFYRGLFPTLGKVIPSVSISYTVYEYSKQRLGTGT